MKSYIYIYIILTKQGEKFVLTQIMPFIEPYENERHHRSKLISYAVISVANKKPNKYGMTISNMSMETNK